MVSAIQDSSGSFDEELLRRDALLTGVAEAARQLLAIADFDAAVNGALETIATSAGIDRIFIIENHAGTASSAECGTCPYEWTVANVVLSREVPGRFPMVYGEIEGFSEWLDELKAGRCVQKKKKEMSAQGQVIQDIDQALSVLTVPIFVEGEYWGNLGFDDCKTERIWSAAEIAVLETAAASFAGALQRREAGLALERRDVLLESVNRAAQCLLVSDELAQSIPAALQILGEGAGQDRLYILENVYPQGEEGLFWQMPYEWVISDSLSTTATSASVFPIPVAAFPDFVVAALEVGQPVQFLTRELEGIALALNDAVATQSNLAVQVQVAGQYWGVLGFDDCTTERV